jgi:hypothetical protein
MPAGVFLLLYTPKSPTGFLLFDLGLWNISKLFQYALMYWLHLSMQENYTKLHEQIILHPICKKLSKRNMPKHPQRNPPDVIATMNPFMTPGAVLTISESRRDSAFFQS